MSAPASVPALSTAISTQGADRALMPPRATTGIAKPGASLRSTSFDAVRVASALAILLAHTARVPRLARVTDPGLMGTSFFAAAAMYFLARTLRKDPSRSYAVYARARFVRLIVPFAAWNFCYFLLRIVCDHWIEGRPAITLSPSTLLLGYDNKLWFLPFIFLASLIAFPIAHWSVRGIAPRRTVVSLCISVGIWLCVLPQPESYLPETSIGLFLTRVIHVLPCTLWGLAIGLMHSDAERRWKSGNLSMVALGAIAGALLLGWTDGVTVLMRNLGGIGLMALCLSLPAVKAPPVLLKLAPKSFGIYLIHPLLIGCWSIALRRLGVNGSLPADSTVFLLTVSSTIGLIALLQYSQWTAWLIPAGTPPEELGTRLETLNIASLAVKQPPVCYPCALLFSDISNIHLLLIRAVSETANNPVIDDRDWR